MVMNTCLCGIARVDCEYHRPEPEPVHDDECLDRLSHLTRAQKAELELWLVRLSSDCGDYVRTYQDGKLVDEEPAEAYRLFDCGPGRHSFSQRHGLAPCWCGEPPVKR